MILYYVEIIQIHIRVSLECLSWSDTKFCESYQCVLRFFRILPYILQWQWAFNSCKLEELFEITELCFTYNANEICLSCKLIVSGRQTWYKYLSLQMIQKRRHHYLCQGVDL
jgi:hypothetical protein